MPLPFDVGERGTLIERVRSIPGVRRAEMDSKAGELWIERHPDYGERGIETELRNAAAEFGKNLEQLDIRITAAPRHALRSRVRFLAAQRVEESDRIRISVEIEWANVVHRGTADCGKNLDAELHTTAVAVLDALEKVIDQPLPFRVVGVQTIPAFGSELMVAALSRETSALKRLIGAVVVSDDGRIHAAALATLSALNRAMGNFLHTHV